MDLILTRAAVEEVETPAMAGVEPGENQITVRDAQCDNGEEITFVLTAMGKGLSLPEDTGNLTVKDYTLV